jgi:hypothetical protein
MPSACARTVCRTSLTRVRTGRSTSLRAAAPFPAHPSSRRPRRPAGSSRPTEGPRRRRRSRPRCSLSRSSTPSACAPTASPTFLTLNRAMAAWASQSRPARAATSTRTTLSSRRLRRRARSCYRDRRSEGPEAQTFCTLGLVGWANSAAAGRTSFLRRVRPGRAVLTDRSPERVSTSHPPLAHRFFSQL